jgi:hypothetical protein
MNREEMDEYPELRKTFYAYKHRRDPERFGLLEAVDYKDAVRHLGSAFYVRTVRLPWDFMHPDREQKREIVDCVFAGGGDAASRERAFEIAKAFRYCAE